MYCAHCHEVQLTRMSFQVFNFSVLIKKTMPARLQETMPSRLQMKYSGKKKDIIRRICSINWVFLYRPKCVQCR